MQEIADHDGLENIELELAVHAPHRRCDVVTHHLCADHRQRLALSRVDFTRHDRGARFVFREYEFAQTAAGAGAKEADILRDLEEGAREGVEGTGGLDHGVVGGEDLEFVGGCLEFGTCHLANFLGDGLVEALEGIQAGADRSASLCEITEVGEGVLDTLDAPVKLSDVAGKFLTQRERGGVL